jgi:hypothetical protein
LVLSDDSRWTKRRKFPTTKSPAHTLRKKRLHHTECQELSASASTAFDGTTGDTINPIPDDVESNSNLALVAPDNSRFLRKEEVSGDEVTGKYVNEKNDFIKLNANGTFSGQDSGRPFTGIYTRHGETIKIRTPQKTVTGKLYKDTLVAPGASALTKKAPSHGQE